jgi:photosystem II stability/assembly factor-like uncharacterized protein
MRWPLGVSVGLLIAQTGFQSSCARHEATVTEETSPSATPSVASPSEPVTTAPSPAPRAARYKVSTLRWDSGELVRLERVDPCPGSARPCGLPVVDELASFDAEAGLRAAAAIAPAVRPRNSTPKVSLDEAARKALHAVLRARRDDAHRLHAMTTAHTISSVKGVLGLYAHAPEYDEHDDERWRAPPERFELAWRIEVDDKGAVVIVDAVEGHVLYGEVKARKQPHRGRTKRAARSAQDQYDRPPIHLEGERVTTFPYDLLTVGFEACFVDAATGYFIGSPGPMLRTVDGGKSWTPTSVEVTGQPWWAPEVRFSDANRGLATWDDIAASRTQWTFTTHDGGKTWTHIEDPVRIGLSDVVFGDRGVGLADTSEGHGRTEDGGTTWKIVLPSYRRASSEPHKLAIHGRRALAVVSGHHGGYEDLLASNDAGKTWHTVPSEGDLRWSSITFASPRVVYAVGMPGVLKSTDAGESWAVTDGAPMWGRALAFVDPKRGFLLARGGLWTTTDGGHHWRAIAHGSFSTLQFPTAKVGYAIGTQVVRIDLE